MSMNDFQERGNEKDKNLLQIFQHDDLEDKLPEIPHVNISSNESYGDEFINNDTSAEQDPLTSRIIFNKKRKQIESDQKRETDQEIKKIMHEVYVHRQESIGSYVELNIKVGIVWILFQMFYFFLDDNNSVIGSISVIGNNNGLANTQRIEEHLDQEQRKDNIREIVLDFMIKNGFKVDQHIQNQLNQNLQITFLTLVFLGMNFLIRYQYKNEFVYRQLRQDQKFYINHFSSQGIFPSGGSQAALKKKNNFSADPNKKQTKADEPVKSADHSSSERAKDQLNLKQSDQIMMSRKFRKFNQPQIGKSITRISKIQLYKRKQQSKFESTFLRKHFSINMFFLYVVTMVAFVQNIKKVLENTTSQHFQLIILFFSSQIALSNQRQILDFMQIDVVESLLQLGLKNEIEKLPIQKLEVFLKLQFNQGLVKLAIFIMGQIYLYISLMNILRFDVNMAVINAVSLMNFNNFLGLGKFEIDQILDQETINNIVNELENFKKHCELKIENSETADGSTLNSDLILNFSIIMMTLVFIIYTSNSILSSDRQSLLNVYRIAESRQFENIWQRLLSKNVQNGIVIYNFNHQVLSINDKFKELIGFQTENLSQNKSQINDSQITSKNQNNSVFGQFAFPRVENPEKNSQNGFQKLWSTYLQLTPPSNTKSFGERLMRLSDYFNQHIIWSLGGVVPQQKKVNVSQQLQGFIPDKFTFYGYQNKGIVKNLFGETGETQSGDSKQDQSWNIDWSQIMVKRKIVGDISEGLLCQKEDLISPILQRQVDQFPQMQEQLEKINMNMTLGRQGIQKMLKGIQINKIQKERIPYNKNNSIDNVNYRDVSQTPKFGMYKAQNSLDTTLKQLPPDEDDEKENRKFCILEVFESLAEEAFLTYGKTEYNNQGYSQLEDNVCYKLIETKVLLKIHTEVYLIRGKPYFIFSMEDIRPKREFEKSKDARKQDMIQLASICHDLKTPLNCISGTCQILRVFVESQEPDLMTYIKNFDISLEFIFSMIEDIQDLAKFSGNQKFSLTNDYFNVRNFINEVLILFQQQCLFKNIELRKEIDQNLPLEIYSDAKRVKQILMNMISNALKFTFKGHIGVYLTLLDDEEEIQVHGPDEQLQKEDAGDQGTLKENEKNLEKVNAQVNMSLGQSMIGESNQGDVQAGQVIKQRIKKKMKIVIEDTGMGIKQQDLNKLFKHFGKLKDKKKLNTKGTGLGLNISKKIVESMGGTISVESEYKKGTKFTMIVNIQIKNPAFQDLNPPQLEDDNQQQYIEQKFDQLDKNKSLSSENLQIKSNLDNQIVIQKKQRSNSCFDSKESKLSKKDKNLEKNQDKNESESSQSKNSRSDYKPDNQKSRIMQFQKSLEEIPEWDEFSKKNDSEVEKFSGQFQNEQSTPRLDEKVKDDQQKQFEEKEQQSGGRRKSRSVDQRMKNFKSIDNSYELRIDSMMCNLSDSDEGGSKQYILQGQRKDPSKLMEIIQQKSTQPQSARNPFQLKKLSSLASSQTDKLEQNYFKPKLVSRRSSLIESVDKKQLKIMSQTKTDIQKSIMDSDDFAGVQEIQKPQGVMKKKK